MTKTNATVHRSRFHRCAFLPGIVPIVLLFLGVATSLDAQEKSAAREAPSRPTDTALETSEDIERWLEELAAQAPPKLTRNEWAERFTARRKKASKSEDPSKDTEIVRLVRTYTWHAVPLAIEWLDATDPEAKRNGDGPSPGDPLTRSRLIARVMARERRAPGLEAIVDRVAGWTREDWRAYRDARKRFAEASRLYRKHEWAGAAPGLRAASRAFQGLGRSARLTDALRELGACYEMRGQFDPATRLYVRAFELRETIGNEAAIASCLSDLAGVALGMGRCDEALDHDRRALALRVRVGSPARVALSLNDLGVDYCQAGRFEEAFVVYRRALTLRGRDSSASLRASLLCNLGAVSGELGRYEESLNFLLKALTVRRSERNPLEIARVLGNLGLACSSLGRYEEAIRYLRQALARFEKLGHDAYIGQTLANLGQVANRLGRYQDALDRYQDALALRRKVGNPQAIATTLIGLAANQSALGNHEAAIAHCLDALNRLDENRNPDDFAITLVNLGTAHGKAGHHEKALEYYHRVLALGNRVSQRMIAYALNGLGVESFSLGRHEEALGFLHRALAVRERSDDPAEAATSLMNTACVLQQVGKVRKAREHFERGLDKVLALRERLVTDPARVAFMEKWNRFPVWMVEAGLHEARPEIARDESFAFRAVETLRGMATADRMQAALLGAKPSQQSPLAAKARALSNEIDALAKRIRATGGNDGTLKARRRRAALRKRLENRQRDLEHRWRDTIERLERESPEYAQIERPRPISLDALKEGLSQDTAYLTFALGEKHSILLLADRNGLRHWKLPARRIIEDAVAAHLEQMGSRAADPTAILRTGHHLYSLLLEPAGEALSGHETLLVSPEGVLNGLPLGTLVNRETADLRTAPYLAKTHAIVYVNSATVWKIHRDRAARRAAGYATRKRPRPARALVLADPVGAAESHWTNAGAPMSILIERERSGFTRLPDTRNEAFGILECFTHGRVADGWRCEVDGRALENGRINEMLASARGASGDVRNLTLTTPEVDLWLGSAASRKALLTTTLSPYRFIHFACHGHINKRRPGLSALVLSPARTDSGVLKLVDAMNLRLEAEVVTLSGCKTAGGKATATEGFQGLVRAFLFAGADNVIASAWRVPDVETATVLPGVYASMVKDKRSPIEALREAKLGYLRSVPKSAPEKAHPYYWGAWMLWGAGK